MRTKDQIRPSGPTITKVSVPPTTKNGALLPRLFCSAFISLAFGVVTTTLKVRHVGLLLTV